MTGAYDLGRPSAGSRPTPRPAPTASTPRCCPTSPPSRRVCAAVRVPVNVLAAGPMLGLSRADLAAAGAARISLGSGLARVGHAAMLAAARAALDGDFRPLAGGAPGAEVDALLAKGADRR